jgi:hypothetical protein
MNFVFGQITLQIFKLHNLGQNSRKCVLQNWQIPTVELWCVAEWARGAFNIKLLPHHADTLNCHFILDANVHSKMRVWSAALKYELAPLMRVRLYTLRWILPRGVRNCHRCKRRWLLECSRAHREECIIFVACASLELLTFVVFKSHCTERGKCFLPTTFDATLQLMKWNVQKRSALEIESPAEEKWQRSKNECNLWVKIAAI